MRSSPLIIVLCDTSSDSPENSSERQWRSLFPQHVALSLEFTALHEVFDTAGQVSGAYNAVLRLGV